MILMKSVVQVVLFCIIDPLAMWANSYYGQPCYREPQPAYREAGY